VVFRILLLTGWLLLGVAGAVAHWYGPGVGRTKLDQVALHVAAAEKSAADKDYDTTIDEYDAALKALPEGHGRGQEDSSRKSQGADVEQATARGAR